MKWSSDYELGISTVDSQHKRLFELVQDLQDALSAGLKLSDINKLFVALNQYKTRHFQLEEKYMKESNYPGLGEQQKAHNDFTTKFEALEKELHETGLTPAIAQSIQEELAEWIKTHVTGLDKKFGAYYKNSPQNK